MIRTSLILAALCGLVLPAKAQEAPMAQAGSPTPAVRLPVVRSAMPPAVLEQFPEVKKLLAAGDAAGALQALAAGQEARANDPGYFNLTGLIALRAKDYPAAVAAFERVVLMEPDNAGAWLDLAIAATEAGNSASALIYFEHLEAEFSPPPAIAVVINAYRRRIATPPLMLLGWRGQVEMLGGVDTNANSGLRMTGIPLTIGDERLEQILDPSYQARRDTYLLFGANATYKKQAGENLLELALGLRQRSYRREREFSTLDLTLGAGLHRPTALGDASFWLHVSDLSLGGSELVRNLRSQAQFERPFAGCRLGAAGEAEWRRYTNLNNLNANLYWAQTGLACDWQARGFPLQSTLLARAGVDSPTGARAGGTTRHAEVIAQFTALLQPGLNAELSATFATARDSEGYSPLLENNAIRHLHRRYYRFSLSKALGDGVELVGSLDESRVRSNLPLFRQQGRTFSVGVRKQF